MFESAEVGSRIEKAEYKREAPKVRTALLAAQTRLATTPLSVLIVIGGVEGAGKAETVNFLLEWMDARGIRVHAMWQPTDEERERPPMWRFWRLLPPKSKMGIFFGSWYSMPIVDRVFNRIDDAQLDQALDRIIEFERMLHLEGTLVLKFWMHIGRKTQKKRLKQLEEDPHQSWRVTPMDWKFFKKYDKFQQISERALRRTSTGEATWHIVEAEDWRYRNLTVARTILAALEERLAVHRQAAEARGVAIRLEVAPDAGSAELDPKALRRMLDALLDNAIKFNREGGTVTGSARRDDGWLELAVADTGIGIARADLAKLFKPLAQLDAGLARRHGGVGMGLALAHRLAKLHGGTLEVASEPGKGSTFTLRLPIQEKKQ